MTCIHRLETGVIDYVISHIPVYKQIVTFNILNDHEPNSDHRLLTIFLKKNHVQKSHWRELCWSKALDYWKKKKYSRFLKNLNNELNILSNKNNTDDLYNHFKTTLFTSINRFSTEVLHKKENGMTKPWYDKRCNISRKTSRDAYSESLKYNNVKIQSLNKK
jgi:hypothetical protein